MVNWEEIELRLAIIQVLLEWKVRKLEKLDLSKTPPAHRDKLLSYYSSVLQIDASLPADYLAEILQLEDSICTKSIEYLVDSAMITKTNSGYQVTCEGVEYLIDVLNKGVPEQ